MYAIIYMRSNCLPNLHVVAMLHGSYKQFYVPNEVTGRCTKITKQSYKLNLMQLQHIEP